MSSNYCCQDIFISINLNSKIKIRMNDFHPSHLVKRSLTFILILKKNGNGPISQNLFSIFFIKFNFYFNFKFDHGLNRSENMTISIFNPIHFNFNHELNISLLFLIF